MNLLNGRSVRLAAVCRHSWLRAAPPGPLRIAPSEVVFVTLHERQRILDCGVHVLQREVIVVLETLEASTEHAAQGLDGAVLPAPGLDWAIAHSIRVDADARRISQALTEPEYLEAWISMPDQVEGSSIIASKRPNGYRLDQYRAGRVVTSIVGSFLFRHQRKMRLSWRTMCRPNLAESLVDFRIRGNFGSSVIELRQTNFVSADDRLWHQTLWQCSLETLALILRAI